MVAQGQERAGSGNVEDALEQFRQARNLYPNLSLDPEVEATYFAVQGLVAEGEALAVAGQIEEALTTLAKAQSLGATLEIPIDISARSWHTLCRFGALTEQAESVIDACNKAVELTPYDGWVRDSRGLVRTLLGNYDGAIEDFEFFINWFVDDPRFRKIGLKREHWITELESGRNPLDRDTLTGIREE